MRRCAARWASVNRIELVNQAFAMYPAQTMMTDIELAGVVADDHGVVRESHAP